MERRVTVNDGIERVELEIPEELEPLDEGDEPAPGDSKATPGPQGPCLHLGPRGERCKRAAIADGYCAKHHHDPELRSPGRNYTRVLVATVALLTILWPYLEELAHDLTRWMASLH